MNTRDQLLEKAIFDVKIKDKKGDYILNIEEKGISHKKAKKLIEDTKNKDISDKLRENIERCEGSFGFMSSGSAFIDCSISAYMPRIKGEEYHTCPRGEENFGPLAEMSKESTWDKIGDDEVCSYCGSCKPERVIELIKQYGCSILGNTDKGYKWYITRDNVPNASFGAIKFYTMHFTEEQIDDLNKLIKNEIQINN